jgi:TetR/AcrR family transcriptional regulator, tetracycline repressor protein
MIKFIVKTGVTMKIDRAQIVREALILLNEVGLDKMSTRALAARLDVQQPALYWHFKDKRTLMDAMNAEMMRASHLYRVPGDGDDWRSYLTRHSQSFRQALLAYRDGARVHAGSRAEASDTDAAERQLEFLIAQGFDGRQALKMLVTLARFTVGFVLEEQAEVEHPPEFSDENQPAHPLLAAAFEDYGALSQDELFNDGLVAFLDGIKR